MAQPALAEIGSQVDGRVSRILARSLFRDMRSNGYGNPQILALATELIDLVTRDMRGEGDGDDGDDREARPREAVPLRAVATRS